MLFPLGNTAQYGGTSGGAFFDICCLQISRFTASKPSKSAIASVEKFTRQLTTLIARYFLKFQAGKYENPDFTSFPVRFSSFSQFHASYSKRHK